MSTAIAVTKSPDFTGLRLEQTPNGHVVSPWFSFPWHEEWLTGPADCRSRYHAIVSQAKSAFAEILKIPVREVMVTERRDGPLCEWRLGTVKKCALPVTTKRTLPDNAGVIDI